MKTLCVFCGSATGADPAYAQAGRDLAAAMAASELGLVYGGAKTGLMGLVADRMLALGAPVVGVMPEGLIRWEVAHPGLDEFVCVDTMHERKQAMSERADGFVALPGGIGTLEEIFEVLSWAQLGVHRKPCAILNVAGFYDDLLRFLDQAVEQGMVKPSARQMLIVSDDPRVLLQRMRDYQSPVTHQWIGSKQV